MPSTNQKATDGAYESEAERFLAGSNEATARAVMKGIASVDRAQLWLEYEVAHEGREWVVALLNERKQAVTDQRTKK